MSVSGTIDMPIDLFGGLVTEIAAADLPPGASPLCQDVAFFPGSVQTRPGLTSKFPVVGGNPTINYLKTYAQPNLNEIMLALGNGTLYGELSPGTLSVISGAMLPGDSAASDTLFGREYIAFSDGQNGVDIPRQYDGTNFDRVSQVGPGAGPVSANDDIGEAILPIAGAPGSAQRQNNIVTITVTTPHGYNVGAMVQIATVDDASFDGTFTITELPSDTTFQYSQIGANASSENGTSQLVPQISTGIHQVVVMFVTRSGYITKPSPPVSWTASGGFRVLIQGIPVAEGDSNVVARILAFTASGGSDFFYTTGLNGTPNMIIPDNATPVVQFDFSDIVLLSGTAVAPLFGQIELPECAGVIGYSSRLFWWGGRNYIGNFINMTFDGGFDVSGTPLGWNSFAAGGAPSISPIWGAMYTITGDGVSVRRGVINQSAYQDTFGQPILSPNVPYSVRIRLASGSGVPITSGILRVDLFGATSGSAFIAIDATTLTATMQEFIVPMTGTITAVNPDLGLYVYADQTLTLNGIIDIDSLEIFPTSTPFNSSVVYASTGDSPESYDGVTGQLQVSVNDGQAVRSAFKLRDFLYLVKDRSCYVTQDPGTGEPATWTISLVSNVVGTPSAHGTAVGEDWAVIVSRAGLYMFAGSEPIKISQEIQPLWDTINWEYGYTLWVKVDTVNKRILVGVPLGSATSPNAILQMDYRELITSSEIISTPPVHFSSYTGKMIALGLGRKWSQWNIAANSCDLIERPNGTAQTFLGNGLVEGIGNGKIYELDDEATTDDGAAIISGYQTYYFPSNVEEAAMQLRSHRKLYGYLTGYATGFGLLYITAFLDNSSYPMVLPSVPLVDGTPINIAQISRNSNRVLVVTQSPVYLGLNYQVVLRNTVAPQQNFDGKYAVVEVIDTTHFIVEQIGPNEAGTVNIGVVLTLPRDFEIMTNITAERVSYQMVTNQPGHSFVLNRFCPSLKPDPWAPVRGF